MNPRNFTIETADKFYRQAMLTERACDVHDALIRMEDLWEMLCNEKATAAELNKCQDRLKELKKLDKETRKY